MKLQKFRYRCIELCSHFRSPSLLTHGQPSALKRSKSAFLLVVHIPPAASAAVLALLSRPILLRFAVAPPGRSTTTLEGQKKQCAFLFFICLVQKFLEMASMMHKTATKELNAWVACVDRIVGVLRSAPCLFLRTRAPNRNWGLFFFLRFAGAPRKRIVQSTSRYRHNRTTDGVSGALADAKVLVARTAHCVMPAAKTVLIALRFETGP